MTRRAKLKPKRLINVRGNFSLFILSAIKANLKAFLVNRIGDMFFILGIVMVYAFIIIQN